MKRTISCLVVAFLLVPALVARAQVQDKEASAVVAAERWLQVVDDGRYGMSWKEASSFFREGVKEREWETSLRAVRKPLGKLSSRLLKRTNYRAVLPGAPAGDYVVVQFDTVFEGQRGAVETITMMLDKDGQWRAAGYFIK